MHPPDLRHPHSPGTAIARRVTGLPREESRQKNVRQLDHRRKGMDACRGHQHSGTTPPHRDASRPLHRTCCTAECTMTPRLRTTRHGTGTYRRVPGCRVVPRTRSTTAHQPIPQTRDTCTEHAPGRPSYRTPPPAPRDPHGHDHTPHTPQKHPHEHAQWPPDANPRSSGQCRNPNGSRARDQTDSRKCSPVYPQPACLWTRVVLVLVGEVGIERRSVVQLLARHTISGVVYGDAAADHDAIPRCWIVSLHNVTHGRPRTCVPRTPARERSTVRCPHQPGTEAVPQTRPAPTQPAQPQ